MTIRAALLSLALLLFPSTSMADDLANLLANTDLATISDALQSQGLPSQSVIEIKGKIDMGNTNYYSVAPNLDLTHILFGQFIPCIENSCTEQELSIINNDENLKKTFFGHAIRPQLKESEHKGYSVYFYMNTAAHPKILECFKKITHIEFPMGNLIVKYAKTGPEQSIYPHNPASGSVVTKALGPFQPK